MKKVAFYTLGCRVNQYETESIKKQFAERGYEVVPFDSFADVYVVNTCTVNTLRLSNRSTSTCTSSY